MLTFTQFDALIQELRAKHKTLDALYALGLDLLNFTSTLHGAELILIKAVFNPVQYDCLTWWLYDSPKGVVADPAPDKWAKITETGTGELVADLVTIKTLHDYLMSLEEPNQ